MKTEYEQLISELECFITQNPPEILVQLVAYTEYIRKYFGNPLLVFLDDDDLYYQIELYSQKYRSYVLITPFSTESLTDIYLCPSVKLTFFGRFKQFSFYRRFHAK